jgi:hypothetical protein
MVSRPVYNTRAVGGDSGELGNAGELVNASDNRNGGMGEEGSDGKQNINRDNAERR